MDLNQRKLTRSEWAGIEVPVQAAELQVLQLLKEGYHDVQVRRSVCQSLFLFLKIEASTKNEEYLFQTYLKPQMAPIDAFLAKRGIAGGTSVGKKAAKLGSADRIRLERFDVQQHRRDIFEFVLLDHMLQLVSAGSPKILHHEFYTLSKMSQCSVPKVNQPFAETLRALLAAVEPEISLYVTVIIAPDTIERNKELLRYADLCLYEHQKTIFTTCKRRSRGFLTYAARDQQVAIGEYVAPAPMLALYIAPTGTGKTLTPIALSEGHKIIFVCAARHVGLALAKAAISVGKRIGFAFGCSSADDIRLHYFAAKEYVKHRRSGRILKVDNSVGDNVEILVCDIRSYLPAMHYMLAFFPPETIITYWDEPTITMDYAEHELHAVIRKNWKRNLIPNLILSSATLPMLHELGCTVADFQARFVGAEVVNVVSHDCKKSIPLIDKEGYVVLPHLLDSDLAVVKQMVRYCQQHLTLLRYLDLTAVVEVIRYLQDMDLVPARLSMERFFESPTAITMQNIKTYYLTLLEQLKEDVWPQFRNHFRLHRVPRILENTQVDASGKPLQKSSSVGPGVPAKQQPLAGAPLSRQSSVPVPATPTPAPAGTSGVYVTTKDAYTLSDGPTIFLTDDVEKVAKFCIQQANIPLAIMDEIMKKIEHNNALNEQIHALEQQSDYLRDQAEQRAKNDVSTVHKDDSTGKKGIKVAGRNKSSKDLKKLNRETNEEVSTNASMSKLAQEMRSLKALIKSVRLHDMFVPNKPLHKEKWAPQLDPENVAFTSDVEDHVVNDIMALQGVENSYKILLMMGIGVFIKHPSIGYTEIMKRLAEDQKLYMIIATSDYIYGTNYQFCHGFLSKDLQLTQEKIIQAMGRIGRNNIQQTYTMRFRDEQMLRCLFTADAEKPEVINMNVLFNSRKVVYTNGEYVEIPDDEGEEEMEEPADTMQWHEDIDHASDQDEEEGESEAPVVASEEQVPEQHYEAAQATVAAESDVVGEADAADTWEDDAEEEVESDDAFVLV